MQRSGWAGWGGWRGGSGHVEALYLPRFDVTHKTQRCTSSQIKTKMIAAIRWYNIWRRVRNKGALAVKDSACRPVQDS
eukprot:scaffold4604_cov160-Skeletonema_marinoi.AAC.2